MNPGPACFSSSTNSFGIPVGLVAQHVLTAQESFSFIDAELGLRVLTQDNGIFVTLLVEPRPWDHRISPEDLSLFSGQNVIRRCCILILFFDVLQDHRCPHIDQGSTLHRRNARPDERSESPKAFLVLTHQYCKILSTCC